jgi:hypothetical protein
MTKGSNFQLKPPSINYSATTNLSPSNPNLTQKQVTSTNIPEPPPKKMQISLVAH